MKEHNATTFAKDANVYDALGEAYGMKGDKQSAHKLALDKDLFNTNAKELLRRLEK